MTRAGRRVGECNAAPVQDDDSRLSVVCCLWCSFGTWPCDNIYTWRTRDRPRPVASGLGEGGKRKADRGQMHSRLACGAVPDWWGIPIGKFLAWPRLCLGSSHWAMGIQPLAHVSHERLQENATPRESKAVWSTERRVHGTMEYFGLTAL